MKYDVDSSWWSAGEGGDVVLAGSPARVFRLTAAGAAIAERIEHGDDVAESTLVRRLVDTGAIHPRPRVPGSFTIDDVTVVTPQLGGVVHADGRVTVDDGSTPPLVGASVRLDSNRGPSAARNVGRTLVETRIVAFVDADVDLPADSTTADGALGGDWWDRLVAHFDDPRVGLVAPRVRGAHGTSLDLGPESARIRSGTRVSYVPAAMILVRTEAFDDVGGFDEGLRFGEDVDFVWRLDQAGWRCRYEPASTVWHRPRPTIAGRMRQQFGYGSSSAPLALRHPRAVAPVRIDPWAASTWLLLAAGRIGPAAIVAAASATHLVATLSDVPTTVSVRIVADGQVAVGAQLARAVRRAWWPVVLAACLVSRRIRRVTVAAMVAAPRTALGDIAFGAGMWAGMIRHRTSEPIVPRIIWRRGGRTSR